MIIFNPMQTTESLQKIQLIEMYAKDFSTNFQWERQWGILKYDQNDKIISLNTFQSEKLATAQFLKS